MYAQYSNPAACNVRYAVVLNQSTVQTSTSPQGHLSSVMLLMREPTHIAVHPLLVVSGAIQEDNLVNTPSALLLALSLLQPHEYNPPPFQPHLAHPVPSLPMASHYNLRGTRSDVQERRPEPTTGRITGEQGTLEPRRPDSGFSSQPRGTRGDNTGRGKGHGRSGRQGYDGEEQRNNLQENLSGDCLNEDGEEWVGLVEPNVQTHSDSAQPMDHPNKNSRVGATARINVTDTFRLSTYQLTHTLTW